MCIDFGSMIYMYFVYLLATKVPVAGHVAWRFGNVGLMYVWMVLSAGAAKICVYHNCKINQGNQEF